jgi:small conductance mechanosensitive channel
MKRRAASGRYGLDGRILHIFVVDEKTLRDRPVEAHVFSYGDSSIQYVLRFWARTEDYWTCYNDVLDGMQEVFSAAGITMCYPHINVHMGS